MKAAALRRSLNLPRSSAWSGGTFRGAYDEAREHRVLRLATRSVPTRREAAEDGAEGNHDAASSHYAGQT